MKRSKIKTLLGTTFSSTDNQNTLWSLRTFGRQADPFKPGLPYVCIYALQVLFTSTASPEWRYISVWGNSISGHTSASRDCWLSGAAYPSLLLPVAIFSRVSLFSSQHHSSLCVFKAATVGSFYHTATAARKGGRTWRRDKYERQCFCEDTGLLMECFFFKSTSVRLNKRLLFGGVIDQFHEVTTSDFSAWHPSTGNGASWLCEYWGAQGHIN